MKEYIVTCKTKEDLESLYDDMETPGGNLYIPDREVELVNRRLISRNTHYMLTAEEAEQLKQDERILDVDLTPEEKGVVWTTDYHVLCEGESVDDSEETIATEYDVTTNFWSKSTNNNNAHRPWAKYRCRNQETVSNWGDDSNQSISGTVQFTSTGQNVDVVIVDGAVDPNHPEFAVNDNGTGGTRVTQFNWYSLNPQVTGGISGTFLYTDGGNGDYTTGGQQQADNNHGTHVAGTVAGNRCGWAIKANIYNITPLGDAADPVGNLFCDYIRAWHNSKDVNPVTGKRNPTIMNNSWGGSFDITQSSVNYINYRGKQFNGPFTTQDFLNFGLQADGNDIKGVPLYSTAFEADLTDAINDGIIITSSSGNNSHSIDVQGGIDYDNLINYNTNTTDYYNRGEYFDSASTIVVGNIDADVIEEKSLSSTTGPRVDVLAPGENIMSSVLSGGVTDSRNTSYRFQKYGGTSMSTPQVTGVLACIAEHWPRMTHYEAMAYLGRGNPYSQNHLATVGDLVDPGKQTTTIQVTASGLSSYTFAGDVTGTDPTVTITEGEIIRFELNCPSHPFVIKWDITGSYSGNAGYDNNISNFDNNANYPNIGSPNVWHEDANGIKNYTSTMFQQTSGTLIWDTRNMNSSVFDGATFWYQCGNHGNMYGQIVINPDTDNRSLQGGVNNYLKYPKIRRVPNPTGSTYIGAETTSQVTWPRLDNKFRPILNFSYDIGGRDGSTIDGGDIDEDIHGTSKMIYPRHPIWNRRPI